MNDVILYHNTCRLILQAAIKYFDYYRQDHKLGSFHHLVSLITSHQSPVDINNQIRENLYAICGTPYCPHIIQQSDLSKIKNLTPASIFTIKSLANVYLSGQCDNLIEYSSNIRGIGPWTVKCAYILTETSFTQSLYEDAYVKRRLSEIHGCKMTLRNCKDWFKIVPENSCSLVSYFLWKVQSSGIQKLLNNQELNQCDFL